MRPRASDPILAFDPEPPAVRSSRTSTAAAALARPFANKLRNRILAHLLAAGDAGCTDAELQSALQVAGDSERPQRVALVQLGLVQDSGHTRPTSTGMAATVWRATAAAGVRR